MITRLQTRKFGKLNAASAFGNLLANTHWRDMSGESDTSSLFNRSIIRTVFYDSFWTHVKFYRALLEWVRRGCTRVWITGLWSWKKPWIPARMCYPDTVVPESTVPESNINFENSDASLQKGPLMFLDSFCNVLHTTSVPRDGGTDSTWRVSQ